MNQVFRFTRPSLVRGGSILAKNVTFEVSAGQYVELHGANGSGKTTLLRMIAGLDELIGPDALSIFYFAHQTGFRPELKVADQFKFSMQILGARANVDQALLTVGLQRQASLQVRELSSGQQRRLLMAVMALSQRSVWLIDEPLNALDEEAKTLFATLLTEHLERGGIAIIATHQRLYEALPELKIHCSGNLVIESKTVQFQPESNKSNSELALGKTDLVDSSDHLQSLQAFFWSVRREFKLIAARPAEVIWPTVFYVMVTTLFPLAIGMQPEMLQKMSAGIFWMSAMFSILMAANRLFELDDASGVLVQAKVSRLSLTSLTAGKIVASWLYIGVPIAAASYPVGLLYHLPVAMMNSLCISLLFGLVSLTAFSALFAALGLMARQAQVIMSLLAFPVFVPLLIFGTAAVNHTGSWLSFSSPMFVLASLASLTILMIPSITAKVLALAVE